MTQQQCQSTEGSISPKDRLQSHQVHLTVLQTYACIQHTVIHNTQMNLSTVKWAQRDKTQSRELLGRFICVCIALCTIVAHNIAQNRPDSFPSCPSDNLESCRKVHLKAARSVSGRPSWNICKRRDQFTNPRTEPPTVCIWIRRIMGTQ